MDASLEVVVEHLEPLVPVADLARSELPDVFIPQERVNALEIVGHKRALHGPGSSDNHIRGVLGEYAVAKHLGIPEAVDTEIYAGGDGGWDLKYRGRRINVKTAGPRANNPSLFVSAEEELRADFYVLVHQLNPSNYKIIGYAPSLLIECSRVRKLFSGPENWPTCYASHVRRVDQDSLRPIGRLRTE